MNRRLACADVPGAALQLLLRERPEWKGEAVVLLDRDEARGQIVDLNSAALSLGLSRGMLYGPSLGIHRRLKGAALPGSRLREWQKTFIELLWNFSPFVEQSAFEDGTFWLDARGLSHLFAGAASWLKAIREAIEETGLECGLALGTGRFSTFAAARLKPAGPNSIFAGEDAERSWLNHVPIDAIAGRGPAMPLFRRLKIRTVGDLMKIPEADIGRRLGGEAARMIREIRRDRLIPLQYAPSPTPEEWLIRFDDPVHRLEEIREAGHRLIDKALRQSERRYLSIRQLIFEFSGRNVRREEKISPAHPTRSREQLFRLLDLRAEYIRFANSVDEIRCRASFAKNPVAQGDLFEADFKRHRRESEEVLAAIQAERGSSRVQYAEILDDPLPARSYRLRDWRGFPPDTGGGGTLPGASAVGEGGTLPGSSAVGGGETLPGASAVGGGGTLPGASAAGMKRELVRRFLLTPRKRHLRANPRRRVVYSGGWWSCPYCIEMAYEQTGHRWEWFQREWDGPWICMGWVD